MGKHKFLFWLMVTIFLVSIYSFAIADDEDTDRLSLKGLKGIYVKVLLTSKDVEELENRGINKETIKTDVELKLRMAGVKVVSIEELNKIIGKPFLTISLVGITVATKEPTKDKHIAFGFRIAFFQDVFLARNMESCPSAETWSLGSVGHAMTDRNIATFIRGHIKDLTDRFINAYLSVNPKVGK